MLQKQEKNANLEGILGELGTAIEGGSTFSEALAQHPKVFNRLFVNMVKAGEIGGVLEVVLERLSEFMEKAQKIKGKVIAAMFYPCAVITVATGIMGDPDGHRHPQVQGCLLRHPDRRQGSAPVHPACPGHQRRHPAPYCAHAHHLDGCHHHLSTSSSTSSSGRRLFDKFKLKIPVLGPVISKVAISRFTRTLGTLVSSGVPILQALTIVKETSGNVVIGRPSSDVHESVKEGETITAPLEASRVFPPMVVSMVDVGEQTGALPEMLMKIADSYDEEVDNAVASMTSLLEPIMIVFLAVDRRQHRHRHVPAAD